MFSNRALPVKTLKLQSIFQEKEINTRLENGTLPVNLELSNTGVTYTAALLYSLTLNQLFLGLTG